MARLSILLLLLIWTSLLAQTDTVFFCNPGQQIQLNALPGQFAYEWSPIQGLNDPTINDPIARPVATTLYVVQVIGEGTGDNLIINPDFTDGNTGVISDYSFVSSISTQGVYGVNSSAANLNRISFDDCPDHTSGTGQMMVVDGSPVANERVWCQTITVETETNYAFSTWLTSVNPINPARLQFSINGRRFGGIFTAGETVCDWRQFYAVWNAATATEAEICIVNQNTNPQGNDFALDDFAFFKIPAIIMDSTLVLLPETTHSPSVVRKPDCGTSNGAVAISSTSDGPNQFVYSLDGGPFLPDTVFQGLITGTHTIAIRNDHPSLAGETCIEELEVFLPQGDCPFYLPSVFSPNNDGINDVFRVFTANGFTGRLLSFTIHDRWGGLVFTGNGADPLTTGWDGRVRGISAANGTYLYQVKLENDEGEVTERNGTVVLVR
ncbi:MAG: gliding motility-associated C-terminal domain-containing protein [Lewinella sp.]